MNEPTELERNLSMALVRLYILQKACEHDMEYLKQYKDVLSESMLKKLQKPFVSISGLIKSFERDFEADEKTRAIKADIEEMPYLVMEYLETKFKAK